MRSLTLGILVATLAFPALSAVPVQADTPSPDQSQVDALSAKIRSQAGTIHQLTEQLDQARLRVTSTSARLQGVTRQHEATILVLAANRGVLTDQAVRAYMRGGATPQTATAAGAADATLGHEYLRIASGDLAETADRLRQLDASLRRDQATLQEAQQASEQATGQLQTLRTNALATAAKDQVQLDALQSQLTAKAQAAAAVSVAVNGAARPTAPAPTQGLPVNNGLVSVVQQAAGLPIATPVVKPGTPTTVAPVAGKGGSGSSGGGNAGGVWLQLRTCESSDNYAENTGNGFYGAYQFSASTWTGLGYPGRPDQESPAMQDEAAMKLQAQSGWGQWPACSAALGLK